MGVVKKMKVKTIVEFSGVPKNTTGICNEDHDADWSDKKVWKVTWDLERKKPLIDWFDEVEFKKYLKVLEEKKNE